MDYSLLGFVLDCVEQRSLQYIWHCRNLELNDVEEGVFKECIKYICKSSFDYCDKNKEKIKNNKSLDIVSNICNCDDTAFTTVCKHFNIKELGEYFNTIAGSGRSVKECYDCGTVSRAIFLSLVKGYKGYLSQEDKKSIFELYNPQRLMPMDALNEFYKVIKSTQCHAIFMVSIGLDNFGHIWTIEKRNGKYFIYQSALASYLVIDYLEYTDAANDEKGINIDAFYRDLKRLVKSKKWTIKEYELFCKLFHFMPHSKVINAKNFLYCYVCL